MSAANMERATIAAVSTAPGEGGIAIVRISGEDALGILQKAFRPAREGKELFSHRLTYGVIVDENGENLDEVMAVYMRAPGTYTREDVAEIQCHGGRVCAARVLRRVCELGCVPAAPGEFTRRAFLNGRVDLSRAEALMQLIGAQGEDARRASLRQMQGGVFSFIADFVRRLNDLIAEVQVQVDFPEEYEGADTASALCGKVLRLADELERRVDPDAARILREGASVVIVGRPNVGKSSLMNAILHSDRAIVTEIPGTTRDVLNERMELGGVYLQLSDTAGIRRSGDAVEQIGVHRARKALEAADIVLLVLDISEELTGEDFALLDRADARYILCLNKCDLPAVVSEASLPGLPRTRLSARSGEGVDALGAMLLKRLRGGSGDADIFTVERHVSLAREALSCLRDCAGAIGSGVNTDVAALDLWRASELLTAVTGANATDSVIDAIFANFCVGK